MSNYILLGCVKFLSNFIFNFTTHTCRVYRPFYGHMLVMWLVYSTCRLISEMMNYLAIWMKKMNYLFQLSLQESFILRLYTFYSLDNMGSVQNRNLGFTTYTCRVYRPFRGPWTHDENVNWQLCIPRADQYLNLNYELFRNENQDIAIAMFSSHADSVLGLNIQF